MGKIEEIFCDVTGVDEENVTDELTRENCEEWDSFAHLVLVSELENETGKKVSSVDVEKIKSLADIRKYFGE